MHCIINYCTVNKWEPTIFVMIIKNGNMTGKKKKKKTWKWELFLAHTTVLFFHHCFPVPRDCSRRPLRYATITGERKVVDTCYIRGILLFHAWLLTPHMLFVVYFGVRNSMTTLFSDIYTLLISWMLALLSNIHTKETKISLKGDLVEDSGFFFRKVAYATYDVGSFLFWMDQRRVQSCSMGSHESQH